MSIGVKHHVRMLIAQCLDLPAAVARLDQIGPALFAQLQERAGQRMQGETFQAAIQYKIVRHVSQLDSSRDRCSLHSPTLR